MPVYGVTRLIVDANDEKRDKWIDKGRLRNRVLTLTSSRNLRLASAIRSEIGNGIGIGIKRKEI